MIRIPLTFFCLISVVCRVSSQPGFSAVIVDVHRMPVQYALVRNLSAGGGAYSNEKGLFSVPVKSNNDSLRINHTGFKDTTVVAHSSADTIVLQEASRQLENINVYARQPKLVKMGSMKKVSKISIGVSSIEYGRMFFFNVRQKHLLKTILIPCRNTDQEIGGRVNVYNVTNGYPQALLASQMVNFEQRDNRLHVIKVDMEPKQITVQQGDTLLVSFEFLGYELDGEYKNCIGECEKMFTILLTKNSGSNSTYHRRRFFEETWHSFVDGENGRFWKNRDLACSILLLPLE